ncbi:hypothetical protein [Celeribacter sp.]|uniref:hypothetical protein n=1 Tax=Celeribacter sp. TaxID=1890673 RepID=UPI003A8CBEB1
MKFPDHRRVAEDRVLTLNQHMRRGPKASVEASVASLMRWHGFSADDAAIIVLTLDSRESAVRWWVAHIQEARKALFRRGVEEEKVVGVIQRYTALVRERVKEFRALPITKDELAELGTWTLLLDDTRRGGFSRAGGSDV